MSKTASPNFRPKLESLEDRLVPTSVVPSPTVPNGINIWGDSGADEVFIRDNGDGDLQIQIGVKNASYHYFDNIESIWISTKGATDVVVYEQNGDRTRDMEIKTLLSHGVDGFAALIHGGIQSGNTLQINTEGGDGADYLGFNMKGDVEAGAVLDVKFFGDVYDRYAKNIFADDQDELHVLFSGELDGLFELAMYGQWGNDRLIADLYFEPSSSGQLGTGSVPAQMDGGGGDDTMKFEIRPLFGLSDMRIEAVAKGGSQDDTCQYTANVDVNADVETAVLIP